MNILERLPMNIAIIEDLPTDSTILSEYLNTYFSHNCIGAFPSIRNFESGEIFLPTFSRNSYDIIFIDYYLCSLSGLDTAYAIRRLDSSVIIIFTTSSRDFAVESYKVKASGYLVKPFSFQEFSELLSLINIKKLKERQFIEIVNGYHTIRIPLNDIVYCDISGHYIQIHTQAFGMQRSRISFSKLCDMLKSYPEFLMCYRGCIINMNHVDHMDDLTFYMDCGERIPFRKKDHNNILQAYSEFLFDKVRKG